MWRLPVDASEDAGYEAGIVTVEKRSRWIFDHEEAARAHTTQVSATYPRGAS